jgi:hypothetical protein
MRRTFFIFLFLIVAVNFFAQDVDVPVPQEETFKPYHQIEASYGYCLIADVLYFYDSPNVEKRFGGIGVTYSYTPVKWLSIGFIIQKNLALDVSHSLHRYYYVNGCSEVIDSPVKKTLYSIAVSPQLRFRYFNSDWISLYSGFAFGVAYTPYANVIGENIAPFIQLNLFGMEARLLKNHNLVVGLEFGFGFKSLVNAHVGWRL